jgi:hypothetical protein
MPMPYQITWADGHRAEVTRDRAPPDWPKGEPWKRPVEREYVVNKVQVKAYPDGRQVEATEEEIAVAQYVAELEANRGSDPEAFAEVAKQRNDALARVKELEGQLDAARAKKGGR